MRHANIPITLEHLLRPKLDDKTYIFCNDFHHSSRTYRHHSVNKMEEIEKKFNLKSISSDKTLMDDRIERESSNDNLTD